MRPPCRRWLLAACLAVAALTVGAWWLWPLEAPNELPRSVAAILNNPDRFELLSIRSDGMERPSRDGPPRYAVLGRLDVTDSGTRGELVAALKQSLAEGVGAAMCFRPRHVIRASKGQETAELVFCFECCQVEVYLDGSRRKDLICNHVQRDVFNRTLRSAGVPVALDLEMRAQRLEQFREWVRRGLPW